MSRVSKPRHRATEKFSLRPSEKIADRLRLVAALVEQSDTVFDVDGVTWNGSSLAAIAAAQKLGEAELSRELERFRDLYVSFSTACVARQHVLDAAIAAIAARPSPPRQALRLCRLRRPPLAKIDAAVAEARRRVA